MSNESTEMRCGDPCCYVSQCANCEKKERAAKKKAAAPKKQQNLPMCQQIRFDMSGSRLDDDEQEFDAKNWPVNYRLHHGAHVEAHPVGHAAPPISGQLYGFAGRFVNGVLHVTKYYIQTDGVAKPVMCLEYEYDVTLKSTECDDTAEKTDVLIGLGVIGKGKNRHQLSQEDKQDMLNFVTQPRDDDDDFDLSKEKETHSAEAIKNTSWTHQSRMMLYGWVVKLNPYIAPRGQSDQYWNRVASEVANSTKHLSKKEGRIELTGHALRVYMTKQLAKGSKYDNYRSRQKQEATLSGQAGMLSNHETEEFRLLDQIVGMKKDALEAHEDILEKKKVLKDIKDKQMNDEIYKKAMASEEGKTAMFKQLHRRSKNIEKKIEILQQASKHSATRADIMATQLDEQERWVLNKHDALKQDKRGRGETTTDGFDSEDNANRSNSKKGRFHETLRAIDQLQAKVSSDLHAETAVEKMLTEWLQRRLDGGAQQPVEVNNLEVRLKRLDEALERKVVTKEEHSKQRERILSESF
jgi:hypothetical protein